MAALVSVLLAPGCDTSWTFDSKSDNVEVQGRSGGSPLAAGALALDPEGGLSRTARPGGEVVLRFSRPLDPMTVRGAVRVEDETRAHAPVPVEAEVRGREIVLRAGASGDWRPGAVLAVRVAGLPSLAALRADGGEALGEDASVRVLVRAPRRTDRVAPRLEGSDPVDGASGVDPLSPVVLRFSEPMDARVLAAALRAAPGGDPVRVSSGGVSLPCRAWFDRSRRELTVLPESPLPTGARVEVLLTDRLRDANGNPLAAGSPGRIAFLTAEDPPADGAGRLVEAFEDRARLDPLGTTVRWDDPSARGVLAGVVEPSALPVGGGDAGAGTAGDAALLLDPRGGSFRLLVTPADLGGEPRVLKGIQLLAAPGPAPGELLEPAVRVAPLGGFFLPDPSWADDLAWQAVTEDLPGATARGPEGVFSLPFRHPVAWTGVSALLVEVSWRGVAGKVILRAARNEDFRCILSAAGLEPAVLRTAPVLRVETVGERAVARSRWMDAGRPVAWLEPRVRPAQEGSRATLLLQGAPQADRAPGPDLARATAWTEDPSLLDGMRWVRFQVVFPGADPGAAPVTIDEIALPYTAR